MLTSAQRKTKQAGNQEKEQRESAQISLNKILNKTVLSMHAAHHTHVMPKYKGAEFHLHNFQNTHNFILESIFQTSTYFYDNCTCGRKSLSLSGLETE